MHPLYARKFNGSMLLRSPKQTTEAATYPLVALIALLLQRADCIGFAAKAPAMDRGSAAETDVYQYALLPYTDGNAEPQRPPYWKFRQLGPKSCKKLYEFLHAGVPSPEYVVVALEYQSAYQYALAGRSALVRQENLATQSSWLLEPRHKKQGRIFVEPVRVQVLTLDVSVEGSVPGRQRAGNRNLRRGGTREGHAQEPHGGRRLD